MGAIVAIIGIIAVFSIPLSAIIGSYYIKIQKLKINQEGDPEVVRDLRKQVGNLMAENDDIKDRLKNLEYIISDDARRINLDYEKEQVKIDQQNKFNS